MTIVAAMDGLMIADGATFSGSRQFVCAVPKIARLPDGSLLGCAGPTALCVTFRDWGLDGFPVDRRPTFEQKDDSISAIHLRTDGTIWRLNGENGLWFRDSLVPGTIGHADPCWFVDGAVAAGASLVDAVTMAIERFCYIGPPIQVERL